MLKVLLTLVVVLSVTHALPRYRRELTRITRGFLDELLTVLEKNEINFQKERALGGRSNSDSSEDICPNGCDTGTYCHDGECESAVDCTESFPDITLVGTEFLKCKTNGKPLICEVIDGEWDCDKPKKEKYFSACATDANGDACTSGYCTDAGVCLVAGDCDGNTDDATAFCVDSKLMHCEEEVDSVDGTTELECKKPKKKKDQRSLNGQVKSNAQRKLDLKSMLLEILKHE